MVDEVGLLTAVCNDCLPGVVAVVRVAPGVTVCHDPQNDAWFTIDDNHGGDIVITFPCKPFADPFGVCAASGLTPEEEQAIEDGVDEALFTHLLATIDELNEIELHPTTVIYLYEKAKSVGYDFTQDGDLVAWLFFRAGELLTAKGL